MKGRIIEINGDTAVVFTKNAEFVKTKSFSGLSVGDEITIRPQLKYIKSAAAAAAAIAVFVGGAASYCTPVSYVDICINPEIELKINMFDRVIGAVGKNDDGAVVLAEHGVNNAKVDKALGSIIENAEALGFIDENEEKTVVLSVFAQKDKNAKQMYEDIASYEMPKNINKVVRLADSADVAKANEEKMPVGKYLLMTELSQISKTLPKEKIKNYSVKEIITTLDKVKEEKTAVDSENAERKTAEKAVATAKPTETEHVVSIRKSESVGVGKSQSNTDSTADKNGVNTENEKGRAAVLPSANPKSDFAQTKTDMVKAADKPIKSAKTQTTAVKSEKTEISAKPVANGDEEYRKPDADMPDVMPQNKENKAVLTVPEKTDDSTKETPPIPNNGVNSYTQDSDVLKDSKDTDNFENEFVSGGASHTENGGWKDTQIGVGNDIANNGATDGGSNIANNIENNTASNIANGERHDEKENGAAEDIREPIAEVLPPQNTQDVQKREPDADNAFGGENDFERIDSDIAVGDDMSGASGGADKSEFDIGQGGFDFDREETPPEPEFPYEPKENTPPQGDAPTVDFGGWHTRHEPSDDYVNDENSKSDMSDFSDTAADDGDSSGENDNYGEYEPPQDDGHGAREDMDGFDGGFGNDGFGGGDFDGGKDTDKPHDDGGHFDGGGYGENGGFEPSVRGDWR